MMIFLYLSLAALLGALAGSATAVAVTKLLEHRPWQRLSRHDTGPDARVQWSHADYRIAHFTAKHPSGQMASIVLVPEVGHLHDDGVFCLEDDALDYRWRWIGHALQGRRRLGRRVTIGPIRLGAGRDLPEIVAAALVTDGQRIRGERTHHFPSEAKS